MPTGAQMLRKWADDFSENFGSRGSEYDAAEFVMEKCQCICMPAMMRQDTREVHDVDADETEGEEDEEGEDEEDEESSGEEDDDDYTPEEESQVEPTQLIKVKCDPKKSLAACIDKGLAAAKAQRDVLVKKKRRLVE